MIRAAARPDTTPKSFSPRIALRVSDYIAEILTWLSKVKSEFFAGLASADHFALHLVREAVATLSSVDPLVLRLVLVLVASQIATLILAISIEFSARKRRSLATLERAAQQQLAAVRPEIPLSAEIQALPTAHAPPPVARPSAAQAAPAPAAEPRVEAKPAPPVTEAEPAPAELAMEAAAAEPVAKAEPVVEAKPVEPPQPPVAPPPKAPARIGLGLRRTRESLLGRIRAAITGSAKLDDICEGLEEALISADVGVQASLKLVEAVRGRVKDGTRPDAIRTALKDEIARMLAASERPMNIPASGPLVVMLAGVNGVGKTTTVAKLAARMKAERGSVIVAAADTFRAAAIEQLEVWCDRVGVDLIRQKQGSDPAAVAFDAVKAAMAREVSTVLIDTAGRLQTKVNLMEELKKIARVAGRELPGAPHECWLVLDATTGQNALSQAKLFGEAVPLTGVVLAKLDSTAKGGVVIAIAEQLKLPVRFVGVGESVEDLRAFDPREFVEALFAEDESRSETSSGSYAA
jgi:fused signal recognition particle receptor